MPSRHTNVSQEVKPQSIVHHIGRLGSKITSPRPKKTIQRKREGSSKQTVTDSIESSYRSTTSATESSRDSALTAESDDNSSQAESLHNLDCENSEEEGLFETICQNELLLECFSANEHSDVLFLVHFFNHSSISDDVEDILSTRVLESRCKCECRRIDSKCAPLFTGKLKIDPEQPSTVVAIKNGKVLCKLSDIASSACTEVDQWLTRTGILLSKASNNTFLSTSTHSKR